MKKFMLIALLLAIFSVAGLAAQEDWWYATTREGATKPRSNWNQVTLSQGTNNFVYVYFTGDMKQVGADFDKMRVNFTLSSELDVKWQCAYYADMGGGVLGYKDPATGIDGYSTGVRSSGPIETDFSFLNARWSGRDTVLNKEKMTGFAFAINVPRGTGNVTLNISSIEFIGLKK